MCLGIPGRVVEMYCEHGLLMGKVDFGGVFKRVCLEHVPEVQLENFVIVHVGFGLSIIDEEEAQQVFTFLECMNDLGELQSGAESAAAESGERSDGPRAADENEGSADRAQSSTLSDGTSA